MNELLEMSLDMQNAAKPFIVLLVVIASIKLIQWLSHS